MTIDLWIRDTAGRPLALVADNGPIAQVPGKVCPHGSLCPACAGGRA